jgi:hypothetical protein
MTQYAPVRPLQNAVLCQVGMVVKNADRIAAKLSHITGLDVPATILTEDYEKAHTQFRGNPSNAKAKLIIFNLGQVSIEIIEPIGGPSTWREFLDKRGEGVHHIAFTVGDAFRTAESLTQMEIQPVQSGDFDGGKYIYMESEKALGVIVELLEFDSH